MEIGVWTPKAVASKTLPLEEVRILPIGDIQYVSRAIRPVVKSHGYWRNRATRHVDSMVAHLYHSDMLLNMTQVASKIGRSQQTIRRWEQRGTFGFPAAIRYGPRCQRRWDDAVINRWLEGRLNPPTTPPALSVAARQ